MNVFSDDFFLDAFSQAYFPHQQVRSEVFELDGQLWKLPAINPQQTTDKLIFFDFFEPLDNKTHIHQLSSRKIHYLPRVSRKLVSRSEWFDKKLYRRFQAAPTTLWNNFDSWDDFIKHVKQGRSNLLSDSRRKQRKLEKDLGSLQFIFDDHRPGVLETCFRWKSEQMRRQGLPDHFTNPAHMLFFQELAARQLLLISSLNAGDQLLAIHAGMLNQARLYWWVPSYAAPYSQYSPGRLLLHFLLEESFKLKHNEFDFLWGDEDYKWYYATHVRLIEDIGSRPFSQQLKYFLKTILKPFLRDYLKN